MTPPDDLPARDLRDRDLRDRIARLERLLDALEGDRRAAAGGAAESGDADAAPIERLREVAALVQQRAAIADVDEGDALAMRALLEELMSITARLRALTCEIDGGLGGVSAAVDDGANRLRTLEEIEEMK